MSSLEARLSKVSAEDQLRILNAVWGSLAKANLLIDVDHFFMSDDARAVARTTDRSKLGIFRYDSVAPLPSPVDDTIPIQLRIPLFLLSAPPIPGCVASFDHEVSSSIRLGFSAGLGKVVGKAARSRQVKFTTSVSVQSGESKRIFQPVRLKWRLKESGMLMISGVPYGTHQVWVTMKSEFVDASRRWQPLGVEDPSADSIVPDPRARPLLIRPTSKRRSEPVPTALFPLSDDRTNDLVKYQHEYQNTREVSFATALSEKTSGDVGVKFENTVRLTLLLAPGHDYQLYEKTDEHGIQWQVK